MCMHDSRVYISYTYDINILHLRDALHEWILWLKVNVPA